jgi:hypothetical protein
MADEDKDDVLELASQLEDAVADAEEGKVASRALGLPSPVTIGPVAQKVLKVFYAYLPKLFPWLIE